MSAESFDMTPEREAALSDLCATLAEKTGELEVANAWPREQLQAVAAAGVSGWVVPAEFGGQALDNQQLTIGYEQLTQSCLTTTFVLTQQNGAVARIANSGTHAGRERILPGVVSGELFITVGISHLSTSRQHMARPAVTIEETDHGFVLDGYVPWVTGAKFADYIVTGGVLADGRQALVAVPTAHPDVEVLDPVSMLALNASWTGPVRLNEVAVDADFLVAGPIEEVMRQGSGGTGSLTTSALAIGSAGASLQRLRAERENRDELAESTAALTREYDALYKRLIAASAASETSSPGLSPSAIRADANSLVLRSAQAYLAAAKGAGFVAGHPAERAVRESMFFLVWSCPQPVVSAALQEFACGLRG